MSLTMQPAGWRKRPRAWVWRIKSWGVSAPNETPLGTVIAAPEPDTRELFCRNGLKWHTRIPAQNIHAAQHEIERLRKVLRRAQPAAAAGKLLGRELDLAARMAAESCHYMLWQQAVASGKKVEAPRRARRGIQALQRLEGDFGAYWPLRNKATPKHCSPFLNWRIKEYQGDS